MPSHDLLHAWGWMGVVIIWAIWTLIVFGVAWAMAYQLRPRHHRPGQEPAPEDALEILKRRYARGELTREQFEQMKHDIRH